MNDPCQKIKYLVADTTAFINAVQLNEYADNILTVPDVVAEVRNKRQIRRLCVLPFDLQVKEPRADSVKHCVEFAKKTGDYASLSGIDIKVIALTYELEKDHVGIDHLRKEPVISKVVASRERPEEFLDKTKLTGWYDPGSDVDSGDDEFKESEDDSDKNHTEKSLCIKNGDQNYDVNASQISHEENDEFTEEDLNKIFEKLKCKPADDAIACDILVPQSRKVNNDNVTDGVVPQDCEDVDDDDVDFTASNCQEDDDVGWITPGNIKKVKKSLEGKIEDDIVPIVACMSTDFALQNVLKQINLHIAALNGRIIKHLRTYILRCYTCFKTTSIMTKVFCPNCGHKTLKRVAVSLDDNGKQVIHINTRRPLTTKFKNQSLPRFQGGKHSRNPILFEDQPIPRQMPSRVAKTKTNALEEDYIAGFSPFVMRDVDSKSAMLRSKGHLKEWARNNTFEEDRRKKHYNRLYK